MSTSPCCSAGALADLSAQLGMPGPDDFYEAISRIAGSAAGTAGGLVVESSGSVALSGLGTSESPLVASFSPTALTSTDGSIVITPEADGSFDLSATVPPILTADTATILLDGDGDTTPLSASLAPGAITSTDGTITVTQEPDGSFDLSAVGGGGAVVTADTASIGLAGDGSIGSPLTATLAAGALTSPGGTITITQVAGGAYELEATGIPSTVVTADSATVTLTGDGSPGTPLTAAVVPGSVAVDTADTATVTFAGDGTTGAPLTATIVPESVPIATVDTATVTLTGDGTTANPLSATAVVPPATIDTADSPTVTLTGDGTVGTPLTAAVVPGSVAIVTQGSPTISLIGDGTTGSPLTAVVLPASVGIDTVDSASIAFTGDGTAATPLSATVIAGGVAIDTADTPTVALTGDGTTGAPLAATVPPTAIVGTNAGGLTPVTVTSVGGVFNLGVAIPPSSGTLPQTITVGAGTIGTTPSAATLNDVFPLLPGVITADNPWTLLMLPGVHSGAMLAQIPANVNLVALEPGSVVINATGFGFENLTAVEVITVVSGIRFESSMTWNVAAKTGGTAILRVFDSVFDSTFNAVMRGVATNVPLATALQDQVYVQSSELNGPMGLSGGLTQFFSTRVTGEFGVANIAAPVGLYTLVQVSGGTYAPATLAAGTRVRMSFEGAAIGGTWTLTGPDLRCFMNACIIINVSEGTISGLNTWLLRLVGGPIVSITETPLPYILTRTAAGAYTYRETNFDSVATAGTVDRHISFMIAAAPALGTAPLIAVTITPPLTTAFSVASAAIGNAQLPVSALDIHSTGGNLALKANAGTTSLLNITNQTLGGEDIVVEITPPMTTLTPWYP